MAKSTKIQSAKVAKTKKIETDNSPKRKQSASDVRWPKTGVAVTNTPTEAQAKMRNIAKNKIAKERLAKATAPPASKKFLASESDDDDTQDEGGSDDDYEEDDYDGGDEDDEDNEDNGEELPELDVDVDSEAESESEPAAEAEPESGPVSGSGSDNYSIGKKELSTWKKSITDELAQIRALFLGQASGPSLARNNPTRSEEDLVPIPANRSAMCVDDFQSYMGILSKPGRWLESRAQARDIVAKAAFVWDRPWSQQPPEVKTDAANALRERITEFAKFMSNWGASHLIQDTFNHRRGRITSSIGEKGKNGRKANDRAAVKTKVDKRKRAYKQANLSEIPNPDTTSLKTDNPASPSASPNPRSAAGVSTASVNDVSGTAAGDTDRTRASRQASMIAVLPRIGSGSVAPAWLNAESSVSSVLKEATRRPPSKASPFKPPSEWTSQRRNNRTGITDSAETNHMATHGLGTSLTAANKGGDEEEAEKDMEQSGRKRKNSEKAKAKPTGTSSKKRRVTGK